MSPENIRKTYFLKISENLWFSNVFRGFRNGAFAENGSVEFIQSITYQDVRLFLA